MKKLFAAVALTVAMALLLSGCGLLGLLASEILEEEQAFDNMEYTRPDALKLEKTAAAACQAAEGDDFGALEDLIYDFFDQYQWFYTNLSLADIHYCIDMTDTYWLEEYNYCMEWSTVVDAAREDLLYALADSKHREKLESDEFFGADYFDDYEGESIYDETFLALMEKETALINEYYEVSGEASAVVLGSNEYYEQYGTRMAEILVELVKVRQQQAAWVGYDSYPEFAYDFYHGRDYTPQEADRYTAAVAEELYDLYVWSNTSYNWDYLYSYCYEDETRTYVEETAKAIGGDLEEAFRVMTENDLNHISYSENKYNASFEVYLTGYEVPFVFMNPRLDPSDKLTFVHEFGHFTADYVCYSSMAGTDIMEVHSQGLEYLSLFYGPAEEELAQYKLVDSLCIYMEQSAYAQFEQALYGLTGDELTVENVQALYEDTLVQFGFDSWGFDSRGYVTITHFYTSPMYIISYVVSNDVALQLYQKERSQSGAGLELYKDMLYSDQWYIRAFAQEYGLEDPLDTDRLKSVRQTFTEGLGL